MLASNMCLVVEGHATSVNLSRLKQDPEFAVDKLIAQESDSSLVARAFLLEYIAAGMKNYHLFTKRYYLQAQVKLEPILIMAETIHYQIVNMNDSLLYLCRRNNTGTVILGSFGSHIIQWLP